MVRKAHPAGRSAQRPRLVREPREEDIREYAYHLYEQGGRVPGHDLDHWLEARATLQAALTPDRPQRIFHGAGPLEQEELCAFSAESHNLAQ